MMSGPFMPHGHCYLWEPGLVALQVISNGSIGVAYVAIAAMLAYLVWKGRDIPFKGMAAGFGLFIVSCGLTHFFDIYVIWDPVYWIDGGVRAVTAVAAAGTAIVLVPLVPKAMSLARASRAAQDRGVKLEGMLEELETLYRKTKELDELKTDSFANVSHELRTPLTLILGPAERLRAAGNLDDTQRRDLDVILRNGRMLLKHVNDLLDVARLEGEGLELTYTEIDVVRLVRRAASQFEAFAEEQGMPFEVDAPDSLMAAVDADKLERVTLNLLSNAFKFTPPGQLVRCSISRRDDAVRIEVADGGPGISPEKREAVFERFRQVDGGAERGHEGTGLGLAIVEDFVELHGGEVGADAAPEGGALIWVELPAWPAGDVEVQPAAEPEDSVPSEEATRALEALRQRLEVVAPESDGERPAILVVEDNPEMNRFICEALAHTYRVSNAFDGREGLEAARSEPPDLVLTDIMMPVMSGDKLVRALREEEATQTVPIIVLTAKADDALRVELLEEGAQDYLTKPFSAPELLARVSNLVTMKRSRDVLQTEIASQVADLENLSREVTVKKRELEGALEAMRVARERAEHANQLKTDFLNMVSHELRSPLTTLDLQLSLLDEAGEHSTDRQRRAAERMRRSASRLTALVDSLLHYARLDSGRVELDVQSISVASVLEDVAAEGRTQAADKGLDLEVEPAAELPLLRTDPELLRTLLSNLTTNAVKYTEQGRVTLSARWEDGSHVLEVSDTGPGIPEDLQELVFRPFEQLEQVEHKHVAGVGLGLAIVRELVQALHGEVTMRSKPGEGTCFAVVIPGFDGKER